MGSAALILVKWVRVAATLSLLVGMCGILYQAFLPYYWYRGAMGIFGVASGCAGFFTIFKGTEASARIYYFSLLAFIAVLCLGNLAVLIKTRRLQSLYCSTSAKAGTVLPDLSHDCDQLKLELIAAISLLIVSILIFGPLAYIVRKFVKAIELEGPLQSTKDPIQDLPQ